MGIAMTGIKQFAEVYLCQDLDGTYTDVLATSVRHSMICTGLANIYRRHSYESWGEHLPESKYPLTHRAKSRTIGLAQPLI